MTRKILNPVTLATIVVIIYTTMPIISVFISAYVTTYAYMLLTVFLIGFIMLYGGVKRLNTIIYFLFPFAVYIACTFFVKSDSVLLWGYKSMLFVMPILLGYYYLHYRSEHIRILSIIIITALFITTVTTIIGLIQFPFAARTLATIAESDDPQMIEYSWYNIGGYSFVYTTVLLYPLIIYAFKQKKIPFLVALLLTSLVFLIVILSEYAIALLFILFTSPLYLTKRELTAKNILVFAVVGFIAILLFNSFFSFLLEKIANISDSETIRERLLALAGGEDTLEAFDDDRIWLYRDNLSLFLNQPIFGTMFTTKSGAAGHSQILITLAHSGIFGGAAMFFMYRNIYKNFFRPFENAYGYGYLLLVFIEAIMLSAINTDFFFVVISFIAPILFCSISGFDKSNTEEQY